MSVEESVKTMESLLNTVILHLELFCCCCEEKEIRERVQKKQPLMHAELDCKVSIKK